MFTINVLVVDHEDIFLNTIKELIEKKFNVQSVTVTSQSNFLKRSNESLDIIYSIDATESWTNYHVNARVLSFQIDNKIEDKMTAKALILRLILITRNTLETSPKVNIA